jgi:hypothetical protein
MPGCKSSVPAALDADALCVVHFLVRLEQSCDGMRRETATGEAPQQRHAEIVEFIQDQGERLSHVSTSGLRLPDEVKARILSGFLALMNLRENLDRAASRAAARRKSI